MNSVVKLLTFMILGSMSLNDAFCQDINAATIAWV